MFRKRQLEFCIKNNKTSLCKIRVHNFVCLKQMSWYSNSNMEVTGVYEMFVRGAWKNYHSSILDSDNQIYYGFPDFLM